MQNLVATEGFTELTETSWLQRGRSKTHRWLEGPCYERDHNKIYSIAQAEMKILVLAVRPGCQERTALYATPITVD